VSELVGDAEVLVNSPLNQFKNRPQNIPKASKEKRKTKQHEGVSFEALLVQ
jgi:hypothetical protein